MSVKVYTQEEVNAILEGIYDKAGCFFGTLEEFKAKLLEDEMVIKQSKVWGRIPY